MVLLFYFLGPLCTRVKIRILRCADVFLHMKLCAGAKIKLSQITIRKKIFNFSKTKFFEMFLVLWWKLVIYYSVLNFSLLVA